MSEQERFEVGAEVDWFPPIDSPGHYMEGQKVAGLVISAYPNGGSYTYRLKLDRSYRHGGMHRPGQPIIVGGVGHSFLRRPA